jgi:hypothetical protein
MNKTASILQGLVRGTGLIQILIGLSIWLGFGMKLIPVHMWIGILFVLSFLVLAILAARARAGVAIVSLALVWGAVTFVFGMAQPQLLPGSNHWVIRILHLLVGVAAMGQAEGLARRIREARSRQESRQEIMPAR